MGKYLNIFTQLPEYNKYNIQVYLAYDNMRLNNYTFFTYTTTHSYSFRLNTQLFTLKICYDYNIIFSNHPQYSQYFNSSSENTRERCVVWMMGVFYERTDVMRCCLTLNNWILKILESGFIM